MKFPPAFNLLLILFLFLTSLHAKDYPVLFAQLGTPLFQQQGDLASLKKMDVFKDELSLIGNYVKQIDEVMKQGLLLDIQGNDKEKKSYLKSLRKLQNLQDKIEKSYKQKLYKSINENNESTFYTLMQTPLSFLTSDARLKKEVVSFYKTTKHSPDASVSYLNRLSQDLDLDEKSYAYLNQIFQLHQEKQDVQARESLESFTPDSEIKNPIQVVSVRVKGGFDLYVENSAYHNVTIKLQGRQMQNIKSSQRLPYVNSYPPRSRSKILDLSIIDPMKSSSFQTQYSTIIGGVNPNYDKAYLYALPYKRGEGHLLGQGFNGKYTHKGDSAYALDFNMPIGTSVHAMRNGVVVALESKHTEHGFSREFASKSNYVIIEHDDKTMAMYGHLDVGGVKVKLGQKVYKYQSIALSGNTGYSSGPHLHVHITAIKSFTSGSASVPFIFLSQRGQIDSAITQSVYTAR